MAGPGAGRSTGKASTSSFSAPLYRASWKTRSTRPSNSLRQSCLARFRCHKQSPGGFPEEGDCRAVPGSRAVFAFTVCPPHRGPSSWRSRYPSARRPGFRLARAALAGRVRRHARHLPHDDLRRDARRPHARRGTAAAPRRTAASALAAVQQPTPSASSRRGQRPVQLSAAAAAAAQVHAAASQPARHPQLVHKPALLRA